MDCESAASHASLGCLGAAIHSAHEVFVAQDFSLLCTFDLGSPPQKLEHEVQIMIA
jgi:hypothetical protein